MNRDSQTPSFWQSTVDRIPPSESAAGAAFDVIIIGAGITGLTTGLLLQQSGKSCLILEAHSIAFGTTAATTAHLNTILDTPYSDIRKDFGEEGASLTARATGEAIALIRDLAGKLPADCDFKMCSGYLYATDEKEEKALKDIKDATAAAGISCYYTDQFEGPMPYVKAVAFEGQAQFNPLKYLRAVAEAFRKAGGIILEHHTVTKVAESGDKHLVHTADQVYTATYIVHATHTPMGINLMSFRLAPYRSYVIAAELEDENLYPEGLIYDMQDPYYYYRTALQDGKKMLLAGGCDHKTGHGPRNVAPFRELESHVGKFYPLKKIHYRWSSQYYESADGLPYIGHFPGGGSKEYVATGFSGNGMTLGAMAAKIIADLILTGASPFAQLFSPSRIKPVAGFANFIKENADVLKHFIADRLSGTEIEALSSLAREEGSIVRYQQTQLAVFKDAQGNITALNPTCRHAGCIVQWNQIEKSWDCPCHGARYAPDGRVLNGPATSPLKRIELE